MDIRLLLLSCRAIWVALSTAMSKRVIAVSDRSTTERVQNRGQSEHDFCWGRFYLQRTPTVAPVSRHRICRLSWVPLHFVLLQYCYHTCNACSYGNFDSKLSLIIFFFSTLHLYVCMCACVRVCARMFSTVREYKHAHTHRRHFPADKFLSSQAPVPYENPSEDFSKLTGLCSYHRL